MLQLFSPCVQQLRCKGASKRFQKQLEIRITIFFFAWGLVSMSKNQQSCPPESSPLTNLCHPWISARLFRFTSCAIWVDSSAFRKWYTASASGMCKSYFMTFNMKAYTLHVLILTETGFTLNSFSDSSFGNVQKFSYFLANNCPPLFITHNVCTDKICPPMHWISSIWLYWPHRPS